MSTSTKVGDKVWLYDANRGRTARECWFARKIESETRTSWVIRNYKIDKATGLLRGADVIALHRKVEFSRDAVEADIWRDENRHRVIRAIEGADIETLKAIDVLLSTRDLKENEA